MSPHKDRTIPMRLEPIPHALFILISLIFSTIKRGGLEGYGIDPDKIIDGLLALCRAKKTKDFNKLKDVYIWVRRCLQIGFDHQKGIIADQDQAAGKALSRCLSSIIKEMDFIYKTCRDSEKCGHRKNCQGTKLLESDICPECIGLKIRALAEDLYASRLAITELPQIDLKSSYLSVPGDRAGLFEKGGRPWVGIEATWEQEATNGPCHVFFQFNAQYYHLKDYLILPYLLLHEYAVHGFTNSKADIRNGRSRQRFSIFFEGWLDFTVINYLKNRLTFCLTDEPAQIDLPYSRQRITFYVADSRRRALDHAHKYRIENKKRRNIGKGAHIAKSFLNFLHQDCSPLFSGREHIETVFNQISCDVALDKGMKDIERDRLVTGIGRALDGGDKDRKSLKICLENSLTRAQRIDSARFITSFARYSRYNQDPFSDYLDPSDGI